MTKKILRARVAQTPIVSQPGIVESFMQTCADIDFDVLRQKRGWKPVPVVHRLFVTGARLEDFENSHVVNKMRFPIKMWERAWCGCDLRGVLRMVLSPWKWIVLVF